MRNKLYFNLMVLLFFPLCSFAETVRQEIIINGVKANVWASSELENNKNPGMYSPAKAFDGDRTTAWAEGAKENGVGEWIAIEFNSPQLVSNIVIINGYQKNDSTFIENNRIKKFDLILESKPSILFNDLTVDTNNTIQLNKLISFCPKTYLF